MSQGLAKGMTRRALLGGALGAVASAALAEAPLRSLRPVARPGPVPVPTVAEIIADARLGGPVGFVVADASSGRIVEQAEAALPLPPASVAKAITALYALDTLGDAHRFETSVIATGPLSEGVLQGDLVLAGGGDPVLSTDDLADLATALKAAGLREVRGAFLVWDGALPYLRAIDPGQQDHLGYNPAVSGLNLNFNRVHFEWVRAQDGYRVTMDARSGRHRPDVDVARMRVVDRSVPVYTYAAQGGVDDWTVARGALGNSGARWLPVRSPALYAGDVFGTMARAQGIALGPARVVAALPGGGAVLARHRSDTLSVLARDMLEYSTNLTAEALGLAASAARGAPVATLAQSSAAMNDWALARLGIDCGFVDHSGLGYASRISAVEMVDALVAAGVTGPLRPLLKDIVMLDDDRTPLRQPPGHVVAKTGTLHFVSALSGYLRTPSGADLAFAIFTADPSARAIAKQSGEEIPAGARAWAGRSRRLQQRLLQRWAVVHA